MHPNNRDRDKYNAAKDILKYHNGYLPTSANTQGTLKNWGDLAKRIHVEEQNKRSRILSNDDICNVKILAGLCNTVDDFLRQVQ